jgi:hypothetical protein
VRDLFDRGLAERQYRVGEFGNQREICQLFDFRFDSSSDGFVAAFNQMSPKRQPVKVISTGCGCSRSDRFRNAKGHARAFSNAAPWPTVRCFAKGESATHHAILRESFSIRNTICLPVCLPEGFDILKRQ